MTRKGRSITLSLEESDKAQLEAIALELGMKWGDDPNISRLIKAIARRQLLVSLNNNWSRDRINTLNKARTLLIDAGQIEDALVLAHLLLERSEITLPLRQEIEQFVTKPTVVWQIEIDRYIRQQQPFQLAYQDAAERIWNFTIYYAEITHYEQRQYLHCWCEETDGNYDLPALAHNWCLRWDRISDASVSPVKGQWRSQLDSILVEMHLLHRLAFAYHTKTAMDEINEWLTDPVHVRRVVRRVTNIFWFFREVRRYGSECVIVSPEAVRDRFKQELIRMMAHYDTQ
ncbi:WCX domain-containing protein [Thermocoleostomius sinensis]|uniref:WYL domain-containing protein n=1 Tax=Thermocoleostomius sinensis A174 TaxID=2016057 RepID=A0A9E8ZD88_9CYAN|nr:WYL domain-containing protein [Thermocoleostomius sinensis]WAL59115.1 WYL domain-containing protein [Thermocoleostomius sinensis A174]